MKSSFKNSLFHFVINNDSGRAQDQDGKYWIIFSSILPGFANYKEFLRCSPIEIDCLKKFNWVKFFPSGSSSDYLFEKDIENIIKDLNKIEKLQVFI